MREVVVGDVEQQTPDVRDVGAAEPAVQAGRLALASHPGVDCNKFLTLHNSVSSSYLKEDAVTASIAATATITAKSAMLSSEFKEIQ